MAESLVGPHLELVCGDCRFPFRCDAEHLPETGVVVCPNCGCSLQPLPASRKGDRVLVDRLAFLICHPKRWDVVALRRPTGELAVKRVVGLPGERIEFRRGDVYVDGKILRKSLDSFRAMATLVHDDRYRPARSRGLPERWKPEMANSGWRSNRVGHWNYDSDGRANGADDWLVYHHWRCYSSAQPRTDEAPISDNVPFNQGESRPLRNVGDVLLSADVRWSESASLRLRIHDGLASREVEVDPARGVLHGDLPLPRRTVNLRVRTGQWFHLEFGLFDEQAVLAIDGHTALRIALLHSNAVRKPTARPIGIRVTGGAAELNALRVFRDVYYLGGPEWARVVPQSVPKGEWFVVGDNVAVSQDSRYPQWACNHLLGKVLCSMSGGLRDGGGTRSAR